MGTDGWSSFSLMTPWEMTDSRTGAGKIQDDPRASCSVRNEGNAQGKENTKKKRKKLCQCVKKAQIPSKRNPNYQNCNILNKNVVLDYDPNVKLICTSPH
jgi:hypothetical protein